MHRSPGVGVALMAAAMLAAAGCRGEAESFPPPTPTRSATQTPAGPTPQDFAIVVAEHAGEWEETVGRVDADCGDPHTVVACSAGYLTLSFQAQTIDVELASVGEPPASVAALVAETQEAAKAVASAERALSEAAGCVDPLGTNCVEEYMQLSGAIDELSRELDAWSAVS